MSDVRIPIRAETASLEVALRRRPLRAPAARLLASSRAREAALYAGASVSYVAAGVFFTELALSWVIGIAWLMAWVRGVPALARYLRGCRRPLPTPRKSRNEVDL